MYHTDVLIRVLTATGRLLSEVPVKTNNTLRQARSVWRQFEQRFSLKECAPCRLKVCVAVGVGVVDGSLTIDLVESQAIMLDGTGKVCPLSSGGPRIILEGQ